MPVPINRKNERMLAICVAPIANRMQRLPDSAPRARPKRRFPNDNL